MATESVDGGADEAQAALLATHPGAVERILAEHVTDSAGHCVVCSSGATAVDWPCTLRGLAVEAKTRSGHPR